MWYLRYACRLVDLDRIVDAPLINCEGVCGWTDITWNDLTARESGLLYTALRIASVEVVTVADSGGQSARTMSPGANIAKARTILSMSPVYCCWIKNIKILACARSISNCAFNVFLFA